MTKELTDEQIAWSLAEVQRLNFKEEKSQRRKLYLAEGKRRTELRKDKRKIKRDEKKQRELILREGDSFYDDY